MMTDWTTADAWFVGMYSVVVGVVWVLTRRGRRE